MKKLKKLGILLFVVVVGITASYQYLYKDHRNIAAEKPAYKINTQELLKEFTGNYIKASEKYLDKVIIVNGKITDLDKNTITINNSICIQFLNTNTSKFNLNDAIKVKGRCIGYDELLEMVKMDQCTIVK
jgi:hypothetical protein